MKVLCIARLMAAACAAMLLASCSSMVAGGVSLAKKPQIREARRVAISQAPELRDVIVLTERFQGLSIVGSEVRHPLPDNAVAGSLLRHLPPGVTGKLVAFETPGRLAPTLGEKLLVGGQGRYGGGKLRSDADILIVLVPSDSHTSSGYYNPAAGTYFAGASTDGGHRASILKWGPSNLLSKLDALVFSCRDGALIGQTNVIASLNFKQVPETHPISDMCAKSLAKSIFGGR